MKDNTNLNEAQAGSQAKRILAYMQEGHRITPIEALNLFGCFRLGARIADLKDGGHQIESEFVKTESGKHVKSYWINQK